MTMNGDGVVERAADLQRWGRAQPSGAVVLFRPATVLHQRHHLRLPRGCPASPVRHFDGFSQEGRRERELEIGEASRDGKRRRMNRARDLGAGDAGLGN